MLNYYYSSDGRLLEIGYTKDSSRPDALEDHYMILRSNASSMPILPIFSPMIA